MTLLPLIPRGILRLTGPDRVKFLHGLTTGNVKALKPGESHRSLHTSPKGRVLALLGVYAESDALWVETDADRLAWLKASWEKVIIMEDVKIEDRSTELLVTALAGRSSPFPQTPDMPICLPFCRTGPGIEVWATPHETAIFRDGLCKTGTPLLDEAGEEALRIANGMPRYGVDLTEENLPQEGGLDEDTGWISYSKGCYVGQEPIARLHHLGQAAQRLALLKVPEGEILPPGTPVLSGESPAGRVTSSCPGMALAMLKRAFLATGAKLEAGGMADLTPIP